MNFFKTLSLEIERHHRLFITTIIALVLFFGWAKWVVHQDGVAHDNKVLAEDKLKQSVNDNKQIAVDQAKRDSDYQKIVSQVLADNNRLQSENSNLKNFLSQQQEADKTLPPSQLSTRWASLVNLPPENFQVTPPDSITVSNQASKETVSQLDEVQTNRAIISKDDQIIANDVKQNTSCSEDLGGCRTQVAGLQDEIKKQQNACNKEKDAIKASNRKHNIVYAIVSFVAGIIVRGKL